METVSPPGAPGYNKPLTLIQGTGLPERPQNSLPQPVSPFAAATPQPTTTKPVAVQTAQPAINNLNEIQGKIDSITSQVQAMQQQKAANAAKPPVETPKPTATPQPLTVQTDRGTTTIPVGSIGFKLPDGSVTIVSKDTYDLNRNLYNKMLGGSTYLGGTDYQGNPVSAPSIPSTSSTNDRGEAYSSTQINDYTSSLQALADEAQGIRDSFKKFSEGPIPLDPDQQAIIDATQQKYEQLFTLQKEANRAYEGAITQAGVSAGRNMYAPEIEAGNIKSAIDKGLSKLSALQTEAINTVATIRQNFKDKNYDRLYKNYQLLEENIKNRQDLIQKTYEAATKAYDKEEERSKDLAITRAIAAGNTDAKDIAANLSAQGLSVNPSEIESLIKLFPDTAKTVYEIQKTAAESGAPAEILKAIGGSRTGEEALIAAQDWLQKGSGDLAEAMAIRRDMIARGLTPPSMEQLLKDVANQKAKVAAAGSIGGLTTAQFQRLNTIGDNARQDPNIKDFPAVRASYETARSAAAKGTGTGDIVLMRMLAKITDPTTGVREEEFKTFESAQSVLAQYGIALTQKMWSGNRLSDYGREELIGAAKDIYNQRKAAYDSSYGFFVDQAVRSGGSAKDVLPYYVAPETENMVKNEEQAKSAITEAYNKNPAMRAEVEGDMNAYFKANGRWPTWSEIYETYQDRI